MLLVARQTVCVGGSHEVRIVVGRTRMSWCCIVVVAVVVVATRINIVHWTRTGAILDRRTYLPIEVVHMSITVDAAGPAAGAWIRCTTTYYIIISCTCTLDILAKTIIATRITSGGRATRAVVGWAAAQVVLWRPLLLLWMLCWRLRMARFQLANPEKSNLARVSNPINLTLFWEI